MPSLPREIASLKEYALLDSGDFEKLERFGDIVMIRPEPQALWSREGHKLWDAPHLSYARQGREGEWTIKKPVPESWTIAWENLTFLIRPTSFKHTGLFPEQATNWSYLRDVLTPDMSVLNLFGYTGGATVAAASVGCAVTHVDASKPVVTWTRENIERSSLQDKNVRFIVDDAVKFVAREIRRENTYDAILMDPPAFGRGPDGEVWKFEDDLPKLIADCIKLLKPERGLLLVNAYSLGYPALSVENLVRVLLPWEADVSSAELTLEERETERKFLLPTGVVVRARW